MSAREVRRINKAASSSLKGGRFLFRPLVRSVSTPRERLSGCASVFETSAGPCWARQNFFLPVSHPKWIGVHLKHEEDGRAALSKYEEPDQMRGLDEAITRARVHTQPLLGVHGRARTANQSRGVAGAE